METIYQKQGYKDRKEYLKVLAKRVGFSFSTVKQLAVELGENEDFDGLVSTLENYVED